jgi:hypothetical protein
MTACYGMTQFEFDPDKDLKEYKVWLADLAHFPKGLLPLTGYLWTDEITYGQQYACEKLQIPLTVTPIWPSLNASLKRLRSERKSTERILGLLLKTL